MVNSEKQGGSVVRSRLKELVARMEQEKGETITGEMIAEATGVNVGTVSRWMQPKQLQRIDGDVAARLCDFLGCELGDLLYVDRSKKR